MDKNFAEILGYIGTVLTSITFMPQVYLSWKTKKVSDLSIWMIIIVIVSTTSWLGYGFINDLKPVIVANIIVLLLAIVLFYLKMKYKEKKQGESY